MDGKVIRKDGERTAWKTTWIATWTAWMDGKRMRISSRPLLKTKGSFILKVLTTVQQNTRRKRQK